MEYLDKAKKKCLVFVGMLLVLFTITGCGVSEDDIYYYISDQTKMLSEGGGTAPSDLDFKETLYQTGIMVSDTVKALTPWVFVVCYPIGYLIKRLIPKEDKLRRNGMLLFFLYIPGLAVFLGYGFSILLNWFH